MMTIKKALLTIKEYCEKHITCKDCPLLNYGQELCVIDGEIPADWDVEEMMNRRKGNSDG